MLSFAAIAALSVATGACQLPLLGSSSKDPLVAKGNGIAITTSEFKARAEEAPPAVRVRLASPEARRALLDQLVLFRLAARAAEEDGLKKKTSDTAGEQRMVAEFFQKRFNDPNGPELIPDSEVEKYYDENRDEFVQTVRIRYMHLLLVAPEKSLARAKKAAEAKKLRARIAEAEKSDADAFIRISKDLLEDPKSGVTGGLLGLRSKADLVRDFSPAIAEALWKNGNVLSDVLASPQGFHIFKADGGRPAETRTVEDAKPMIRHRLFLARMAKIREQWTKEQRERASVCVDRAALDAVQLASLDLGQGSSAGSAGAAADPSGAPKP